jgi:hypothetical protein
MSVTQVTPRSTIAERRKQLMRSLRWPLVILGGITIVAVLVALAAPSRSDIRFAPNNPDPEGGMAVAEVLGNLGVDVTFTQSITEAESLAHDGATLLIANDPYLEGQAYGNVLQRYRNVVLASPQWDLVDLVALQSEQPLTMAGTVGSGENAAECSLSSASTAGTITSFGGGFELYEEYDYDAFENDPDYVPADPYEDLPEGSAFCFPDGWGYHLVQLPLGNDRQITLFDDSAAWSNARITAEGNAALALHLLGHSDSLVWLLPLEDAPTYTGTDSPTLPPGFELAAFVALVVAVFLALWQGRRFGPVITENLPVVVKASETSLGRARLYRSVGARGRAAAALRAGTATRLAARLGISSSSHSEPLIAAIAHASRTPESEIRELLFGAAPMNDLELTALAGRLTALESEINA